MRMYTHLAGSRVALSLDVSIAIVDESPCPAGSNHLFLKVVIAGIASRHRLVVSFVEFDLVASYRAAIDKTFECLLRQRAWQPLSVITRLLFLRCVDAEQAHELLGVLQGSAINDDEPRRWAEFESIVVRHRGLLGSDRQHQKHQHERDLDRSPRVPRSRGA